MLDDARQNGLKGVCSGCGGYPIPGRFSPALWRLSFQFEDQGRTGTLFACRCPSCGIALLAWQPSICSFMHGLELYWNMRSVQTHYGAKIAADQVIFWSEEVLAMEAGDAIVKQRRLTRDEELGYADPVIEAE